MREIKFRGKALSDDHKWLYGNLNLNDDGKAAIMRIGDFWSLQSVNPDTVGQYTGLKDSKGKEIYEGDIVKATLKDKSFAKRFNMDETVVGKISFDGAWWLGEWDALWRLPRYYDLTVSGNVYDNPELLEVMK